MHSHVLRSNEGFLTLNHHPCAEHACCWGGVHTPNQAWLQVGVPVTTTTEQMCAWERRLHHRRVLQVHDAEGVYLIYMSAYVHAVYSVLLV